MVTYAFAHQTRNTDTSWVAHNGSLAIHELSVRLRYVVAMRADSAKPKHAPSWTELASFWHDREKSLLGFQRDVRQDNAPDAHLESTVEPSDKTHSSAPPIDIGATPDEQCGNIEARSSMPDLASGTALLAGEQDDFSHFSRGSSSDFRYER